MSKYFINETEQLKEKAAGGDTDAMVRLADRYYYEKEDRFPSYGIKLTKENARKEAFRLYTAAAEKGDAEGQYQLGCCYYFLDGFTHDSEAAEKWYLLAAAQGHSDAEKQLGDICADKDDYEGAMAYYKSAADKGDPEAAWEIGYLYENGYGVDADKKTAQKYYDMSAQMEARKNEDFDKRRNMTPEEIHEHLMLERSAAGDTEAMSALSIHYYVRKEYVKAFDWAKNALSVKAEPDAYYILGELYENGYYLPLDTGLAAEQYRAGAALGDARSQKKLDWFDWLAKQTAVIGRLQGVRTEKTPAQKPGKFEQARLKEEQRRQKQQAKEDKRTEKQRLKEEKRMEKERRKYNR